MSRLTLAAILMALVAAPAGAQRPTGEIPPGREVRWVQSGLRVTGTVTWRDGDTLAVRTASSRPFVIQLSVLDSLWVRQSGAGRGALIGGIAGLTAGAVVGLLFNAHFCESGFLNEGTGSSCWGAVPLFGLVLGGATAVVGAGVGAAVGRWDLRIPH